LGELEKRIENAYNWVMNENPKEGACLYDPPTFVLAQAKKAIEDAKKEVGDTKWLDELKEYLLKYAPKLKGDMPIFSARHFAGKIDELKATLERWFS